MRDIKAGLVLIFGNWPGWFWLAVLILWWVVEILTSPYWELNTGGDMHFIVWFTILPVLLSTSITRGIYNSILRSPGLFCVSGLARSLRLFAFSCGFVLSIVFALPILRCKGLNAGESVFFAITWFFLLMMLYLSSYPVGGIMGNVSWMFFIITITCLIFKPQILFLLCKMWPIVAVAGIAVCAVYWHILGGEQARIRQRQLIGAEKKDAAGAKHKDRIVQGVEDFFLARLNRCSYTGLGRYVWGMMYITLGGMLSQWKLWFLGLIVLANVFVFIFREMEPLLVFLYVPILSLRMPAYFDMLTCGGRRERFYGLVGTCVAASVIIAIAFVVLATVSQIVVFFVPQLEIMGVKLTFSALDIKATYIAACAVPAVLAVRACFQRVPIITALCVIFIGAPLLYVVSDPDLAVGEWLTSAGLLPIMVVALCCWGFFIVVMYHICKRLDLVRQSPPEGDITA